MTWAPWQRDWLTPAEERAAQERRNEEAMRLFVKGLEQMRQERLKANAEARRRVGYAGWRVGCGGGWPEK